MKKLFLTLVGFLFVSNLPCQLQLEHGHNWIFYMNCGGKITTISSGFAGGGTGTNISKCFDICANCKLEFRFVKYNQNTGIVSDMLPSTDPLYIPHSSSYISYYSDVPNEYENIITPIKIVDGEDTNGESIQLYSIDFTNINKARNINKIVFNTNFVDGGGFRARYELGFNCFRVIPVSNLDDLTIRNIQICKGDCVSQEDILGGIKTDDRGVQTAVTTFSNCSGSDIISFCFNNVGSFPICATVKDACGVKNLTGNINVIDCTNGLNCETCCNLMNNITSITIGNWFLGGNLMLPDEFFGCGPLDVYIYFSDGTSIVARGSGLVNLGGKTITSICFVPALGCNSCAKCIQLGG
ncbi:MAG: hypothetical protein JNL75_01045 [Chitinophagales bacterium]|nr:hypothetical protein [Chitinophagales bacterium]